MGQLSEILRNVEGGRLMWWCPVCNIAHQVAVGEGPGPRWGWNGSTDRPTFTPSVLVGGVIPWTDEQYAEAAAMEARGEPRPAPVPRVCHSFVVDGQMQMLSDSTHALAGQTVPIPPFPKRKEA